MRNYIELNGKSSAEINGLLIQELPPISKPKMRTQVETIDGRAGDIITQLGFSAYDKTIEIGLYGDFDINEVISYFNSSGQVVFSNEPDKYYNYQILDQIDFQRLIRFRTANVVLHCQPFKYPLNETPLVEEYEYVEATGSNVTLDNTSEAIFNKIDLLGNTSQITTTAGKNLFNKDAITNGYRLDGSGEASGEASNEFTSDFIEISPSTQYVRSIGGINPYTRTCFYDSSKTFISKDDSNQTFTTPSNAYYLRFSEYTSRLDTMQLEKGSTPTTYEPFTPNSPSPSYPQPIHVVSGDNEINICGENLFDIDNAFHVSISGNGAVGTNEDYRTTDYLPTQPNTSYYFSTTQISGQTSKQIYIAYYDSNKTFISRTSYNLLGSAFTTPTNTHFIRAGVYSKGQENVMLKKGSTATTYEPYIGSSYPLYLGNIELCKIGDYQDYIYKEHGSWYLHKEIGKVVLDGSERWILRTDVTQASGYYTFRNADYISGEFTSNSFGYSNYYEVVTSGNAEKNNIRLVNSDGCGTQICINGDIVKTAQELKTWLSTHNTIVYYVLATPTNTLIEDTTLIEQLEEIKSANSYEGQTNISHDSNDAPFLVDVSALQSGSDQLVVDNEGNIYSRPTLDLEGTGIVNVYLEGNQMFQVDLTDTNEIVIDTDEMEAYNPTTQALMNRQVTGNYDNFKLNVGDNTLKFSGDLTKATVTNYVRWL